MEENYQQDDPGGYIPPISDDEAEQMEEETIQLVNKLSNEG